jgi:hypothetical protein
MQDDYHQQYPRRMWLLGQDEDQVLAIENGAIVVGNVDKSRVADVRKAYQSGTAALSLTKHVHHIPLETLKYIRASFRKPLMEVNWQPDKRSGRTYFEINCRDQEECQEVVDALHELPQPAWSRDTLPDPLLARTFLPLVCLFFATLLSFALWKEVNEPKLANPNPVHVKTNWIGMLIVSVIRFCGPQISLGIGYVAIAIFLIWLVFMLIFPPRYDTLTPVKQPVEPDTDE